MTIQDRLKSYLSIGFPEALFQAADGRIVGTWILGNNYQVKSQFYGGYPPTYLKRIAALFPDRQKVLHLFSGKVDLGIMPGDTVDIDAENDPTWVDDAQRLTQVPVEDYDLVLADPPYSVEDCDHYQCSMIKRNLVMRTLGNHLKPGAFVVWLDQVLPMWRKDQFSLVGCIGMYKSTNHRIRGVTIFQKNNLTEKQKSVNMPSFPTRDQGNKDNETITAPEHMTPKLLALIAGILAAAFTQIKNVLTGADDAEDETAPAAPGKKRGRPAATKPEPEDTEDAPDEPDLRDDDDDAGVTTNIEDDDTPDVEETRKLAMKKVTALVKANEGNKKKIRALLQELDEPNLGEMKDKNVPRFWAKLQKLK